MYTHTHYFILQDACHLSQDGIDSKGDGVHRRRHDMASDTAVPQGTSQYEGSKEIYLTYIYIYIYIYI